MVSENNTYLSLAIRVGFYTFEGLVERKFNEIIKQTIDTISLYGDELTPEITTVATTL